MHESARVSLFERVCVSVCVCVCEREREKERKRGREIVGSAKSYLKNCFHLFLAILTFNAKRERERD